MARQTDGQTDWQTLFHRILLVTGMGPTSATEVDQKSKIQKRMLGEPKIIASLSASKTFAQYGLMK